jgi:hypothetical protein
MMTDHSQFWVTDAEGEELADLHLPPDDALVASSHGSDGVVVVATGAYAAPVEVTLELLTTAPPVDDSWEDAAEFSVYSTTGIAVSELMDGPRAALTDQPGFYRVRICALGRDRGAERGETGPRSTIFEQFLVQAWPVTNTAAGVTLKATTLLEVDHTTGRVHLETARAAAQRISNDLGLLAGVPGTQARPLSGETGQAHAAWTYPATRRKLFFYAALLDYWTSAAGTAPPPAPVVGATYQLSDNDYRDIFDGIPTGDFPVVVQATLREVEKPGRVVTEWAWATGAHLARVTSVLETVLTVTLEQQRSSDGTTLTTVDIAHDGLPVEWIADMTACWLCKLESGETVYNIAR